MAAQMRPETAKAFDNILETFASANEPFLNFMSLIRQLDAQAAEGSESSELLLKIMFDFNKLIIAASDPRSRKQK